MTENLPDHSADHWSEPPASRRLHPRSLLLAIPRIGPQLVQTVPALIGIGAIGRWSLIGPAIAAIILFTIGSKWLAWWRFAWRVDADDIRIDSGIFTRTHRTIPFDRIQDVSIEQGLLARSLGLARVSFETGGGGGKAATDAVLDAITLADATALRDHVRAQRQSLAAAAADGPLAPMDQPAIPVDHGIMLFHMPLRRLLIAGLFNFSLAIFAVLFGLLQTFDNVLPYQVFSPRFWVNLAEGTMAEQWLMAHRWLAIGGTVVAVGLAGIVTGVARTIIAEWGFTLTSDPRGLRRVRGLLTRTDVVLPRRRVQSATILTGPVRRRLGWHALHLQSLAADRSGEGDHVVAPLASFDEIDRILPNANLSRLPAVPHDDWQRAHVSIIFGVPLTLAVIAIIAFAGLSAVAPDARLLALLPAGSALLMLLLGWLDWRARRWTFDGDRLHVIDGFLARRHVILPARSIQSAQIDTGPLARRLGIASLQLGVAGGNAGHYRISAMPVTAAARLRHRLIGGQP